MERQATAYVDGDVDACGGMRRHRTNPTSNIHTPNLLITLVLRVRATRPPDDHDDEATHAAWTHSRDYLNIVMPFAAAAAAAAAIRWYDVHLHHQANHRSHSRR